MENNNYTHGLQLHTLISLKRVKANENNYFFFKIMSNQNEESSEDSHFS